MTRRTCSRIRFLAGSSSTIAAVAFVRRRGEAAGYTLKFANDYPESHPSNVQFRRMIEKLRNETGGQLDVQLFPHGVLGGATELLTQVRLGSIGLYFLGNETLANVVRGAGIFSTPFAFGDAKQVYAAMDGALGAYVRGETSKLGLYSFPHFLNAGVREITTSTKPIVQASDLRGFKIRVPVSPPAVAMFRALGASPTAINASELYTALQTHVIDGEENPFVNIEAFKLYEVQKYCSLSHHMSNDTWVVMNAAAKDGLPRSLFDALERRVNETMLSLRADLENLDQTLRAKLTDQGLTFNEVDRETFKGQLRREGFYGDQRSFYGTPAWTLLEKSVGKLT